MEENKISSAINVIVNEMKKKDEYIKFLEKENQTLKKQLEQLAQYNSTLTNERNLASTFNSPSFSIHSTFDNTSLTKGDIKQFLQDVKSKIPREEFKLFIHYIKVLTDKTNTSFSRRKEIAQKIKCLLENENKELSHKFETIISIK